MTEHKSNNKPNPHDLGLGVGWLRTVLGRMAASFHFLFNPLQRERQVEEEYSPLTEERPCRSWP